MIHTVCDESGRPIIMMLSEGQCSVPAFGGLDRARIMKLVLRGLNLADDKETMPRILNHAAPFTRKDAVFVFVTGIGEKPGQLEEDSMVLRSDGTPAMSAIQLTIAAGCVAMVELFHGRAFLGGTLPQRGFVRLEDASPADFLAMRAGSRLACESPGTDAAKGAYRDARNAA